MIRKLVPFLIAVCVLLGVGLIGRATFRFAYAQAIADGPHDPLDAGPAAGGTVTVTAPATSDIAIGPAPTATSSPTTSPADGSTQPATPVAVDASFWSRVEALWRAGSLAPAVILAAYGLLLLARRRVPRLQAGKAAAYSAIAVGALTTLLEPASRGTTPSLAMLISAVTGAVLLNAHPTKQPGATASGEMPRSS